MLKTTITGQGPKVVLIHGWASNRQVMGLIAADLDRQYECHCVDLPGHGAGADGRVDVGLDEIIAGAANYVRSLGEPVVLIGWAMGAIVALAVAAQLTVKGIVCIGTPSGGAELGPAFEKMAGRLVRDWPRYVRSSVDVIVGERVSPEMHAFICAAMQATPPSLARRTLLDVATSEPLVHAAAIAAPVLLMHGDDDKISPVAIADALGAALSRATVKRYPGIGHMPFLEMRDAALADINVFLGAL